MKRFIVNMKCEIKGCRKRAVGIAYNREQKILGSFCEEHGLSEAESGNPEYMVRCPNCDCKFGVN